MAEADDDQKPAPAPSGAAGSLPSAACGGGEADASPSRLTEGAKPHYGDSCARGETARISIGSVSLAEFLVTAAISATFVMTLDLASYRQVVLGLIIGGGLAAPLARGVTLGLPP